MSVGVDGDGEAQQEALDDGEWDESIQGIRDRHRAGEAFIDRAWSQALERGEIEEHDLAVEHAARVDVPTLLAEVERLTESVAGSRDAIGRFVAERDVARAEVERLTCERDNARSKAALLFEQNAEALRLACDWNHGSQRVTAAAGYGMALSALEGVARILGDDETETGS